MKKIRKIGALSLAKMIGATYFLLGLIAGSFISLFSVLAIVLAESKKDELLPLILGAGAIVFLPIIYGLMGFVSGLIGGSIYNLAAKWVGGVEIEIDSDVKPPITE